MLGHTVNVNKIMRATNGNGRKRRLMLGHQNFRGGDMTVNVEKRTQWQAHISQHSPDIMGLSETELGSNENGVCDVRGYTWEIKEDSKRIAVMVNNGLDYKRRRDLETKEMAAIWIEVNPRGKQPILVANVYREWKIKGVEGSGNESKQQERWSTFIEKFKSVTAVNTECHVLGDFNLDRQKWRQNQEDNEDEDEGYDSDEEINPRHKRLQPGLQKMVDLLFEEILNVHTVTQLQKKISFVKTDRQGNVTAKSCLDLYFTNRPLRVTELRLSPFLDSDHMMIIAYRRMSDKMPQPSVIRKRKWSKIDWKRFNKEVQESGAEKWILNCEECENAAKLLTATVRVHLDVQEKVKTYQLKTNYCPWIDESTKMIIERKKTLYEIWKRNGKKSEDWLLYRKQSNYLVKVLRQKKTHYLKQKLRSTVESQDIWKETRSEMNIGGAGPPSALNIQGELVTSPEQMAEKQNNFFIEKVIGIGEQIPQTETDPLAFTKKFLKDKQVPEFNFTEVTEKEVSNVISNLKNTTSTGHDDINVVALKKMRDSILKSLTHVINLSLKTGEFPQIWKVAKVIPLWKNNGDKTESKFYRPIALLPVFSKVLEKFVSRWMNQHMETNKLWSDRQHGYRQKRSTSTALLQLQEEILTKFEEGHDVAVSSYDSSAAFDTLTHKILLEKLKLYGCSSHVIKWFTSYLSERWQYCEIGGKKSSTKRILQGVFQGSVLGPLLYILYVNCISILQDEHTKLSLYADDISAATRLTRNKYENRVRISVMGAMLQRYMDSHHLKFNADKTNLIVKTRGTNNTHNYLNLKMGDKVIEQQDTVKILGVIIGKDEKYREYLVNGKKSVLKFLTTRHNMLKILSRYADLKTRKALAEGLCLSKISYCISVWGGTTEDVIQKYHVKMNDILRTVFGVGRNRFHSLMPMYMSLKWLTLRQTLEYFDKINLQNIIQHRTPLDIAEKFDQDPTPTYQTRASSQVFRLNSKTTSTNTARSKGFVCRAAVLYQRLPDMITESKFLPRAAFKDWCRADIGGWEPKAETTSVLEYLQTLKDAGGIY